MSNFCLVTEKLSVKSLKMALATQERSNFHLHMKYKKWGREDYSGKLEVIATVRPLILVRSAYCWAVLVQSWSCISHTALPLRRFGVGKSLEKDTANPKWPDGCPVPCSIIFSNNSGEKGEIFRFTTFVFFLGKHCVWWSPASLDMNQHPPQGVLNKFLITNSFACVCRCASS